MKPHEIPAPIRVAVRWLRAVVIALVLAAVCYWLFTDSFLTRRLVTSKLRDVFLTSTGRAGEVTVGAVRVNPGGRVQITDLLVKAAGFEGQPGRVLRVPKIDMDVQIGGVLKGKPRIRAMMLDQPVLTLSRNATTGEVNIAGLAKAMTQSGQGAFSSDDIPTIIVRQGLIELGEHGATGTGVGVGGSGYAVIKQFRVSGEVVKGRGEKGEAQIRFRQIDAPHGVPGVPGEPVATPSPAFAFDKGISIDGTIGSESVSLTMHGLDFSALSPNETPSQLRELFERAQFEGGIPKAVLTFNYKGTWESKLTLQGVAMNLPVEVQPDEDADGNVLPLPEDVAGRSMRLQRTSGEMLLSPEGIAGTLEGFLEELPYEVSFRTQGLSASAPWTVTMITRGFRLEQDPEILKFAPGLVRRRLRDFSNPEGVLDTEITLAGKGSPLRLPAEFIGPPLPPEKPTVQGRLVLRDVTAAFHKFPYEFQRLRGQISFDESAIRIERIQGVAVGGATVGASGVISPITEDAGVDIQVRVEKLPIDEKLAAAMLQRAKALVEVFSEERSRELLDRGLVISTKRRSELLATLAGLKSQGKGETPEAKLIDKESRVPAFDTGGKVNVDVRVFRKPGPAREWDDEVKIDLIDVGLLPKAMPYPMRVRGANVLIKNNVATVSGGLYEGLGGGMAIVSARADLSKLATDAAFSPDVEVIVQEMPVDAILLNALPAMKVGSAGRTLAETLALYNPSGKISGQILVSTDAKGEPKTQAQVDFKDVLCERLTEGDQLGVRVRDVSGSVDVDKGSYIARLRGRAANISALGVDEGRECSVELSAKGRLAMLARGDQGWNLDLDASAAAMPLDLRVDRLIEPWSASAAGKIAQVQGRYKATGTVDIGAKLSAGASAALGGDVRISGLVDASLEWNGQRVALGNASGGAVVRVAESAVQSITIQNAAAALASRTLGADGLVLDSPAGKAMIEGTYDFVAQPGIGRRELGARIEAAPAESPLWRSIVAKVAPRLAQRLDGYKLRGVFDAAVMLAPRDEEGNEKLVVRGDVRPLSASLEIEGTPVVFPKISGTIEFAGKEVQCKDLRFSAPRWEGVVRGSAMGKPSGGTDVDLVLDLAAERLTSDLRAVLPGPVRAGLQSVSIEIEGPVTMQGAGLSLGFDAEGKIVSGQSRGSATFERASADMGVRVSEATGRVGFSFLRTPGQESDEVRVDPEFRFLRALGISVTDASMRLRGGSAGEVIVPEFSGTVHGGRVTGSLRVGAAGELLGEHGVAVNIPEPSGGTVATAKSVPRPYELTLEASGVRFAPVLEEMKAREKLGEKITPGEEAVGPPAPDDAASVPDDSRGVLSGNFTLSGVSGDVLSRRGRGSAAVRGGEVVNLPTVVPLMRITNLQLPVTERLDYALADFFVQGPEFTFEQLSVSSKSVGLYGYGTVMLPDLALDLRFKMGNRSRIPILTSILEELRQEIVSMEVRGTVDKPDVKTSSFAGTREVFEGLFGDGKGAEERKLDMIERQVSPRQRRERPGNEELIAPMPPPAPLAAQSTELVPTPEPK